MSSADQSTGLMLEMSISKEEKSSVKVASPGDQKIASLEMVESHKP